VLLSVLVPALTSHASVLLRSLQVYEHSGNERTRTGVMDAVIRILGVCKDDSAAATHGELVEMFGLSVLRDITTLKVAKPARLFALDFVENFASVATNMVAGIGVSDTPRWGLVTDRSEGTRAERPESTCPSRRRTFPTAAA
jgi:hypothetical protein